MEALAAAGLKPTSKAPTSNEDAFEQDEPAELLTLPLDILHHIMTEHLSQVCCGWVKATCILVKVG